MLAELREEQARIVEAIAVIERLAAGHGRRRGRPPGSGVAAESGVPK